MSEISQNHGIVRLEDHRRLAAWAEGTTRRTIIDGRTRLQFQLFSSFASENAGARLYSSQGRIPKLFELFSRLHPIDLGRLSTDNFSTRINRITRLKLENLAEEPNLERAHPIDLFRYYLRSTFGCDLAYDKGRGLCITTLEERNQARYQFESPFKEVAPKPMHDQTSRLRKVIELTSGKIEEQREATWKAFLEYLKKGEFKISAMILFREVGNLSARDILRALQALCLKDEKIAVGIELNQLGQDEILLGLVNESQEIKREEKIMGKLLRHLRPVTAAFFICQLAEDDIGVASRILGIYATKLVAAEKIEVAGYSNGKQRSAGTSIIAHLLRQGEKTLAKQLVDAGFENPIFNSVFVRILDELHADFSETIPNGSKYDPATSALNGFGQVKGLGILARLRRSISNVLISSSTEIALCDELPELDEAELAAPRAAHRKTIQILTGARNYEAAWETATVGRDTVDSFQDMVDCEVFRSLLLSRYAAKPKEVMQYIVDLWKEEDIRDELVFQLSHLFGSKAEAANFFIRMIEADAYIGTPTEIIVPGSRTAAYGLLYRGYNSPEIKSLDLQINRFHDILKAIETIKSDDTNWLTADEFLATRKFRRTDPTNGTEEDREKLIAHHRRNIRNEAELVEVRTESLVLLGRMKAVEALDDIQNLLSWRINRTAPSPEDIMVMTGIKMYFDLVEELNLGYRSQKKRFLAAREFLTENRDRIMDLYSDNPEEAHKILIICDRIERNEAARKGTRGRGLNGTVNAVRRLFDLARNLLPKIQDPREKGDLLDRIAQTAVELEDLQLSIDSINDLSKFECHEAARLNAEKILSRFYESGSYLDALDFIGSLESPQLKSTLLLSYTEKILEIPYRAMRIEYLSEVIENVPDNETAFKIIRQFIKAGLLDLATKGLHLCNRHNSAEQMSEAFMEIALKELERGKIDEALSVRNTPGLITKAHHSIILGCKIAEAIVVANQPHTINKAKELLAQAIENCDSIDPDKLTAEYKNDPVFLANHRAIKIEALITIAHTMYMLAYPEETINEYFSKALKMSRLLSDGVMFARIARIMAESGQTKERVRDAMDAAVDELRKIQLSKERMAEEESIENELLQIFSTEELSIEEKQYLFKIFHEIVTNHRYVGTCIISLLKIVDFIEVAVKLGFYKEVASDLLHRTLRVGVDSDNIKNNPLFGKNYPLYLDETERFYNNILAKRLPAPQLLELFRVWFNKSVNSNDWEQREVASRVIVMMANAGFTEEALDAIHAIFITSSRFDRVNRFVICSEIVHHNPTLKTRPNIMHWLEDYNSSDYANWEGHNSQNSRYFKRIAEAQAQRGSAYQNDAEFFLFNIPDPIIIREAMESYNKIISRWDGITAEKIAEINYSMAHNYLRELTRFLGNFDIIINLVKSAILQNLDRPLSKGRKVAEDLALAYLNAWASKNYRGSPSFEQLQEVLSLGFTEEERARIFCSFAERSYSERNFSEYNSHYIERLDELGFSEGTIKSILPPLSRIMANDRDCNRGICLASAKVGIIPPGEITVHPTYEFAVSTLAKCAEFYDRRGEKSEEIRNLLFAATKINSVQRPEPSGTFAIVTAVGAIARTGHFRWAEEETEKLDSDFARAQAYLELALATHKFPGNQTARMTKRQEVRAEVQKRLFAVMVP